MSTNPKQKETEQPRDFFQDVYDVSNRALPAPRIIGGSRITPEMARRLGIKVEAKDKQ
jgi:hypothetical protein